MTMHRSASPSGIGRLLIGLVAVLALLAFTAGPVAARTTPFSFSYESTETDTSCGYSVQRYDVGTAKVRASDKKFDISNTGVAIYTNLANGLFVSQEYQALFKNRNFVTNADGTQSSDNTVVGSATLYDMNGNDLLRTNGPMTTHLVIDPTLEFPDNIISQVVTFEHGHHDGFCETLILALDL